MKYYRMEFLSAIADEGEEWIYKKYRKCEFCGLKYIEYSSEFIVPDDTVELVHAESWEPMTDPIIQVAGLILGEKSFVDKMENNGISGFFRKDAKISIIDCDEDINQKYCWLFVTGRCYVNDVWEKVVSICQFCKNSKTIQLDNATRVVKIKEPIPSVDLCRSRDMRVGLIVSEKFVEFIQINWDLHQNAISFKELPVET